MPKGNVLEVHLEGTKWSTTEAQLDLTNCGLIILAIYPTNGRIYYPFSRKKGHLLPHPPIFGLLMHPQTTLWVLTTPQEVHCLCPSRLTRSSSRAIAQQPLLQSDFHLVATLAVVLEGYEYIPFTIDPASGTRSSSETALLSLALWSLQLTIYQSYRAGQILFDGNKTTIGVKVTQSGLKPYVLSARKEVMLSAGVVNDMNAILYSRAKHADYNSSIWPELEFVISSSRGTLLQCRNHSTATFQLERSWLLQRHEATWPLLRQYR